jgi:leader peptidase (prepilin peptidase)/N-methyltransferase
MTVVPIICAVASLPVAWFAGVLIDRVPDNEPLRPFPGVRTRGWYLFLYVAMAVLFTLMGHRFDDDPALLVIGYLVLTAMLVTVSVIDIQCYRLPDRIVLPTLLGSVVLVVVESIRAGEADHIKYAVAGAAIYFLFLLVVHLISPRGMGFGDVKLAAVMGLYLGWLAPDYLTTFRLVLWAMLVGFVIGSVAGIALWAIRGLNAAIPFGPFLAFGALVVVLTSANIVGTALNV